ncbi:MAG: hypothetical protein MSS96_11310, partial [Bacteroidales bacterium]|nr:hypothetical protein [Bacteroidales bacterium]
KGYARCFFSVAGLLRSKLRQAGYGEETAFVPQACITARKTMKTGWRGPNKNSATHKITNSPTHKTYFRIVGQQISWAVDITPR